VFEPCLGRHGRSFFVARSGPVDVGFGAGVCVGADVGVLVVCDEDVDGFIDDGSTIGCVVVVVVVVHKGVSKIGITTFDPPLPSDSHVAFSLGISLDSLFFLALKKYCSLELHLR
jgi:hypothetical protein